MNHHRRSFWKTTLLAAVAGLTAIESGHFLAQFASSAGFDSLAILSLWAGWSLGIVGLAVSVSGLLVLYRDSLQTAGGLDLYLRLNKSRTETSFGKTSSLGDGSIWRRLAGSRRLRVGDVVEIRQLSEIEGTLDASGSCDTLPFMPEMARYCGQKARIFRCVDKVYDYGRTKTLRRLKDSYLLVGLRCDGSAHGGCQAGCYIIWKGAWLRPVPDRSRPQHMREEVQGSRPTATDATERVIRADTMRTPSKGSGRGSEQYVCQYTQLAAASTPMKAWDYRQDLRPLLAGNVTLAAFCVALLTRLFNRVQRVRGGVGFPYISAGIRTSTPIVTHDLVPGDTVRVLAANEISLTLNSRGRNRGLWFDLDMLKHAGHRHHVVKRTDRIIDDATGRMLEMKAPCIVLDEVQNSGEYLRFCAQHDHLFWREAWLAPESPRARSSDVDKPGPQPEHR